MIQVHHSRPDYPDAGEGMCCLGAAARGPENCTCWEAEYDQEQQPQQAGPMLVRTKMCGDCAFRHDSPERAGDERYENSGEEGIADLIDPNKLFLCHNGMRRLVRERHPSGAVIEAQPGAYVPGDTARKADGSPAEICAGWAMAMKASVCEADHG